MTLVDPNLLVYNTFSAAPEHERSRRWLEEQLADGDEHGLVLASHDHGFRRFTGLRTIDPLD